MGSLTYSGLQDRVAQVSLEIFGAFHPGMDPDLPDGIETLVLLGPREPGFWSTVTASPEFSDGAADPLDRWSRRVIGAIACDLRAKAYFPFGGPPYRPFQRWARTSGRAHVSPVGLPVHDSAGLMLSYRGALALSERLDLPEAPPMPCQSCTAQPCLSACPADALTAEGYDVPACKAYLSTPDGTDCHSRGCAVRRACPVSVGYGRLEAQSEFHMQSFHPLP